MDKTNTPSGFNSVITGTIIGLIIPLITIFIFYCITPTKDTFINFVRFAINKGILSRLISLCAIPNLGAFFLLMKLNYLYTARGIILATFLVTVGVLILKGFVG